jgi:hypothetical protein
MDTWTLSPGVKRPGREADRSPYLWPRIRMSRALPPLPHITSWHEEGPLYFRPYLEPTPNFPKWPFPFRFLDEHVHEFFIPSHTSQDHTILVSLTGQPNNRIFGQQHKLWRCFNMEHPLTSCYIKDMQHTTRYNTARNTPRLTGELWAFDRQQCRPNGHNSNTTDTSMQTRLQHLVPQVLSCLCRRHSQSWSHEGRWLTETNVKKSAVTEKDLWHYKQEYYTDNNAKLEWLEASKTAPPPGTHWIGGWLGCTAGLDVAPGDRTRILRSY